MLPRRASRHDRRSRYLVGAAVLYALAFLVCLARGCDCDGGARVSQRARGFCREGLLFLACLPTLAVPCSPLLLYRDMPLDDGDWRLRPLPTLLGGVDPRRFWAFALGRCALADDGCLAALRASPRVEGAPPQVLRPRRRLAGLLGERHPPPAAARPERRVRGGRRGYRTDIVSWCTGASLQACGRDQMRPRHLLGRFRMPGIWSRRVGQPCARAQISSCMDMDTSDDGGARDDDRGPVALEAIPVDQCLKLLKEKRREELLSGSAGAPAPFAQPARVPLPNGSRAGSTSAASQ